MSDLLTLAAMVGARAAEERDAERAATVAASAAEAINAINTNVKNAFRFIICLFQCCTCGVVKLAQIRRHGYFVAETIGTFVRHTFIAHQIHTRFTPRIVCTY